MPSLPTWYLVIVAFLFGAVVGSFLNVVIARVPFRQSVVWPPSHCFTCGKPIKASHNIPILSWWLLRGRCANCRAPFSIRYSLIELAYALVCAFAVGRHGLSVAAAREIALMGFLIPLTAMDLDWWLLPHALTLPGTLVGLALTGLEGRALFLNHLLAASIGYTALVIVGAVGERVFKREALGGGDPYLFALIGAFLGLRALLPVLFFASVQGALIGGAMILARRRREQGGEEAQPVPAADGGVAGAAASSAAATRCGAGAELSPNPEVPEAREQAVAPEPGTCTPQQPMEPAPEPQDTAPSEVVAKVPDEDDEWEPDPTAVPFGPFLALGAAEVLYFPEVARILFPF